MYNAKIEGWGFEDVDGKSTVIYNITVMSSNGYSWCVRRRYSEFRDNYLTIQYQFPNSKAAKFSFPRKMVITTLSTADQRKEVLQKYLNSLLKISPTPVEVQYFLRITRTALGLETAHSPKKNHTPVKGHASDVNSDSSEEEEDGWNQHVDTGGEGGGSSTPSQQQRRCGSRSPDRRSRSSRNGSASSGEGDSSNDDETISDDLGHTGHTPARRGQIRQLRRSTQHTKAALRPYCMEHYVSLLDDGDHRELLDYNPSYNLKPASATVLVVYASAICALKILLTLGTNKYVRGFYLVEDSELSTLSFVWNTLVAWYYAHGIAFMWVMKSSLFWFLLCMTFHRIVGWALTVWLQGLLSTPKGAFKMSFESIVLRLGLVFFDNNEILVNNFVWHNPPKFKETPYFARIAVLRLRFDLWSVWDAISSHSEKPIILEDFIIEGLTVHMEQGKREADGLNLWACLGSENAEESVELSQGITQKLASVMTSVGGGMFHTGENLVSGIGAGAMNVVDGVGNLAKGIGSGVSRLTHTNGTDGDVPGPLNHGSPEKFQHDAVSREAAMVAERLREHNGSPDSLDFSRQELEEEHEEMLREGELEFHWGVPYKFLTKQFLARGLTFYVKDFLAAKHSEQKPIVIAAMPMDLDELTAAPGPEEVGRQPCWLDDLLWRVINRLIVELLKTSTLSLLGTVAGSGLNQGKEHLMAAAKSGAKQTIQSVYNYNPKEMANATIRGIHYLRYIGAPNFTRSPSLQDLRVDTLRVYVLSVRGLKKSSGEAEDIMTLLRRRAELEGRDSGHPAAGRKGSYYVSKTGFTRTRTLKELEESHEEKGKDDDGNNSGSDDDNNDGDDDDDGDDDGDSRHNITQPINVKLELKNQPGHKSEAQKKMYQYKTNATTTAQEKDEHGRHVYHFGEVFDVENLITLNAELNIRIFLSSVIKDDMIGEVTLPLKDDISAILDAEAGKPLEQESSMVKDTHGNVMSRGNANRPVKYLCGVRKERLQWYLLYAKGTNEIVGEIQIGMMLC